MVKLTILAARWQKIVSQSCNFSTQAFISDEGKQDPGG